MLILFAVSLFFRRRPVETVFEEEAPPLAGHTPLHLFSRVGLGGAFAFPPLLYI